MGEYLTRYVTAVSLPNQTAESVAQAFIKNIITRHGVPEKVLTDQGTNVMSNLMASLYKQCGVTGIRMLAYRPQCDGMVERVNRTLADMIASYGHVRNVDVVSRVGFSLAKGLSPELPTLTIACGS
jgi:transposase-like protein